ncbi:MAG: heptosyltransferase [Acidobacteriota bacterium]|jgi:ADP-heptose:LPS heptosyltransferase|nr:heptosyltransferase [Acidobacteriota bacterium]
MRERCGETVLVHLAAGVGNVVLATPLLVALSDLGLTVDVLLGADYAETAELLGGWSVVREVFAGNARVARWREYDALVPAVPPFYWSRFARLYARDARAIKRPPASLFYRDEQQFYLSFARRLGANEAAYPAYRLPIAPAENFGVCGATLVIAPGSKSGEMRAKRWGGFARLAELFADVVVVGTNEDLRTSAGATLKFPPHARLFIDQLTLRETAGLLASAGVVVANDSGLAHVAAAVGTPTVMIFGPTPDATLGRLAANVEVLRAGLACEPCWFGARFKACDARLTCLSEVSVERVACAVRKFLRPGEEEERADPPHACHTQPALSHPAGS